MTIQTDENTALVSKFRKETLIPLRHLKRRYPNWWRSCMSLSYRQDENYKRDYVSPETATRWDEFVFDLMESTISQKIAAYYDDLLFDMWYAEYATVIEKDHLSAVLPEDTIVLFLVEQFGDAEYSLTEPPPIEIRPQIKPRSPNLTA